MACRDDQHSAVKLLIAKGATITLRITVSDAASRDVTLLRILDPTCKKLREHLGEMLHHVEDSGHFHMVRSLLQNGAPILACRMKFLIAAAEEGALKEVRHIVEHATKGISFPGKALSAAVCEGHHYIIECISWKMAPMSMLAIESLSQAPPQRAK